MNDLEKELQEIYNKLVKEETEFWWANSLYYDAKEKFFNAKEEEITDWSKELAANIFLDFIVKNAEYCEKLVKAKYRFDNKDLNSLEKNAKEVLENIDAVSKKFPQIFKGNISVENVKVGIEKTKKLISLGREFASLEDKLNSLKDKENFSWQKIKEVWKEVKEKSSVVRSTEWLNKTAQIQKWGFLGEIAELCWEIAEAVAKGGKQDIPPEIYPSMVEELNFLQEIADEVPNMLDWLEREHATEKDKDKKIQEIKEKNEQLKSFIQQERKKHGYSSRPTNKPNPQNTQQIQSLQKEINSLTQKLTELQNEIADLKEKQNTNSPDQPANPEIQQKIETLESQKDQIKETLKQKQSQQEKIKQQTNTQQTNNGFNWLYVVIPGAILLVVMGIIIAYLVGKRNKKE